MDIANLLVGLASLVVSVTPLCLQALSHLRRQSKFQTLQDSFDDVSKRLTRMLDGSQPPWERVLSLMEIAEVLLPQVRARFWRRLILLFTVALATAGVAAEASRVAGSPGTVLIVILLGGANWMLAFSELASRYLLTKEEQLFFKNAGLLQDRFYRAVVADSLEKFNRRCEDLLRDDARLADVEWTELRTVFARSMQASVGPQLPHARRGLTPVPPNEG
jgi:hypothetical protein